jgi:hypothetical protein
LINNLQGSKVKWETLRLTRRFVQTTATNTVDKNVTKASALEIGAFSNPQRKKEKKRD